MKFYVVKDGKDTEVTREEANEKKRINEQIIKDVTNGGDFNSLLECSFIFINSSTQE